MSEQAATERDGAGSLPNIRASRFVAREGELAALTSALAGPPAVVLVEGETGIGKSRLVQEYLAATDETTLMVGCPPFRQPHTLGPVADALRQATDHVRDLRLSPLAGTLRPLFPEWAADLPPAPEPAEDATAARHRLFRALAELLGCLQVTLLVAEDVHWADEATLEFLLYLASGRPQPLSLVVTCRPEDVPAGSLLPRLTSRLTAGAGQCRITLGPLDAAATAEMVSSMLSGEHVSDEFAAFVHQRTDGVPLAVEESVQLMGERAEVFRHAGGWVRRSLAEIQVPPTIREAVLERAQRLGPDAHDVLRAVAVLADPADEATVRAVAAIPAERAQAGLSAALGCGLLAENGRGLSRFRHALACQAVYEAIPGPDRRALHLRAGRALEEVSPLPVAQLARHFRDAGETPEWCRYAEQAADLAIASGDESTAAALLYDLLTGAALSARSVIRLTKKIPFASFTGPVRFQHLVRILRSVLDTGNLNAGEEAGIRVLLGQVLLRMEEFDAGGAELERAIPHLAHDPVEAARAMILLGWPRLTTWPRFRHLRWLRAAAAAARAPMAAADRLSLAVDMTTALLQLGEEEGWAEASRIPADAPTSEERQTITRGNLNIGDAAMKWGRYAEARHRLTGALDIAERHQYLRYRDFILVTLAHLDWFTGAWDGLTARASSLAGNEDIQPVTRLEAALVTGLLDAAKGACAPAEEQFRSILEELHRHVTVEQSFAASASAALARLQLAGGCTQDALRVTEAPIGLVAGKGIWVWATELAPVRAEALIADGRTREAEDLVSAFARGLRGRQAPGPRAGLMVCRAILAGAHGEHARAAALFSRAAAAWEALPRPYDTLLAREHQASCLLAGGRQERGLALFAEVLRGLSRLDATGDADRVAGILRGHGVTARRAWRGGRRGYGQELSPRELEVVRLVLTGRTNPQIARSLSRSPKTVAAQLNSAMRKLGAGSRTALAVTATQAGITPPAATAGLPIATPAAQDI
jgi:DNA-binding CsgD family transcriptional regulator/tetratricopeptide (TPR) repeat protein